MYTMTRSSNPAINLITQEIISQEFLGLQSSGSISEFFNNSATRVRGAVENAMVSLKPMNLRVEPGPILQNWIKKVPYSDIAAITVSKPVEMGGYMVPYLSTLSRLQTELYDIDKRIYLPLTGFINELISSPNPEKAVWGGQDLKLADYKLLESSLQVFLNKDARNQQLNGEARFGDLYRRHSDYFQATALAKEALDRTNNVNLPGIRDAERNLAQAIDGLADLLKNKSGLASEIAPMGISQPSIQLQTRTGRKVRLTCSRSPQYLLVTRMAHLVLTLTL